MNNDKEKTIDDAPLQISEETKLRMVEFFMETSIPRILAKEREEELKKIKKQ